MMLTVRGDMTSKIWVNIFGDMGDPKQIYVCVFYRDPSFEITFVENMFATKMSAEDVS